MNDKHLIEINGVKIEVDLRTAKRVEQMRIGTRVKVLRKKYGDTYEVLHGVIIGFEPFQSLPTIIVALASVDHSEAKIEFVYFNAKSEGLELVVAMDEDLAAIDKDDFIKKIDADIAKKQLEIRTLEDRKNYFLTKFACYWEAVESAVRDATA